MSGIHDPEFRSIDGTGNNQDNPGWGRAGSQFLRKTDGINDNPAYGDGVETPAGAARPGAREVSNAVFAQSESKPSSLGTSDLFWAWGQFLDHDIDLTAGPLPGAEESFPISVPVGDPYFDPASTG